ncbi:unnamed protein product [Effrenium voratum]|nr:unnamed protein product [Effrenium voratum]
MLASRSLLKKQHGCGLIPGKVPTGRAFRRKLLLTTIRRMSDSPNEAAQGTCFEGLLHLFDRNSSKEGCDLEDFSCSLDGPKISTTHSDSAARPARPARPWAFGRARIRSLGTCELKGRPGRWACPEFGAASTVIP